MVFFLISIYKPLISYCFMKCEVSKTNDVKQNAGMYVFLEFMISHMKHWSRPSQILVYLENAQYILFLVTLLFSHLFA